MIWIMGVKWVCKKRLKTWQWFCLSQSYSNLTYLCLSSVKASKRSLYIFLAFSPSTSHIFNQDLTLKKHQCQHCQHWIFLQLFYLKLTHFWRKIHVEEKKKNKKSLSSDFLPTCIIILATWNLNDNLKSTNSLVIPGRQYSSFYF